MNTNQTIILARKHAMNDCAMQSSAMLCLGEAIALQNDGALTQAKARALRSLQYSIGAFHPDFKRACAYHLCDLIETKARELMALSPSLTLGKAMVLIINRESKL